MKGSSIQRRKFHKTNMKIKTKNIKAVRMKRKAMSKSFMAVKAPIKANPTNERKLSNRESKVKM
jgi:hypothetical protein